MPYKDPEKAKEYQRKYSEIHRERKKPAYHKSLLKLKHSMSVEDYNNLLVKQDHKCALCNKHVSELERRLAVDHCHETGRIRGLLCMPCNTSLGQLGDDEKSLKKIISYLNETQNAGV